MGGPELMGGICPECGSQRNDLGVCPNCGLAGTDVKISTLVAILVGLIAVGGYVGHKALHLMFRPENWLDVEITVISEPPPSVALAAEPLCSSETNAALITDVGGHSLPPRSSIMILAALSRKKYDLALKVDF
eukprot:g40766.t1